MDAQTEIIARLRSGGTALGAACNTQAMTASERGKGAGEVACLLLDAADFIEQSVVRSWSPIESAPAGGFFMVWSPDHPEIPFVVRASIFHAARLPGTPRHLSMAHVTHWTPLPPLPAT